MTRCVSISLTLLGCLGACASLPESAAPTEPGAVGVAEASAGAGVDGAAADAVATRQKAPNDHDLSAIWKDEAFQRYYEQSYLAVSDVEPPMTARDIELLQTVMELMAEEEQDKAMSRLRDRLGRGSSAAIDFTLGSLCFQKEQLDEAALHFQTAVEKFPRYQRAWKNLGFVRARLQQYAQAAAAFVKVIETGGGDGMMYGLLGYACANTEDHIAAESAYRMAALMEPERLDWRMGMANSFFKQRRYGEAAALCATLIEQRPDDAKLWLLQANAFVGMKQVDKAAENLELVDRLGKATFDSLSLLGDIYINEGLYELATTAWQRAIAKDEKQNHEPALRAANQLVARAAYEPGAKLVEDIEQHYAASLDAPAKLDLLRLRARLALNTGAGEQEAALLEEIVALDPLDGNSLILLGQYHARNGDVDKAIFRYEQAAEIEAFAADAKVRHAQLLASQGEFEKAVPLLKAAQSLNRREHVQKFLEDVERVAAGR